MAKQNIPALTRRIKLIERTARGGMDPGGDLRVVHLGNPEIRDQDGNPVRYPKGMAILKVHYRLPADNSSSTLLVPVPQQSLTDSRWASDAARLISLAVVRHLKMRGAALEQQIARAAS